jgi:hypothetical protein
MAIGGTLCFILGGEGEGAGGGRLPLLLGPREMGGGSTIGADGEKMEDGGERCGVAPVEGEEIGGDPKSNGPCSMLPPFRAG